MDRLQIEERLMLMLSQAAPSERIMQEALSLLSNNVLSVNYDRLLELANLNRVTPLLYRNLSTLQLVPQEIIARLRTHYITTVQRNAAHLEETLQLVGILNRAGVRSIPLKGSFAAETLLGDMGLYPTSDVDLLIRWDDLARSRESLIAAGYSPGREVSEQDQLSGSYHLSFHGSNTTMELHWNLVRRYFEAPSAYWWEDTGEMAFRGQTFPCLSDEKYILYLIFRLFSKAFMPLHHFVLMPALLNQKFDWNKLMVSAQQLRMRRLSLFTLKLLHDLFGIAIPHQITTRHLFGYGFLRQFVIRGLFSQEVKPHLRMAALLLLLDSPLEIVKALVRRVLPPTAEIRLRYNIPGSSLKILPYYLLNPILMFCRKTKRSSSPGK